MKNFFFHNTTKYYNGRDIDKVLEKELSKTNLKKVLLLAGSGSIKKNNAYQDTVAALENAGIAWVEEWGVTPNPTLAHARKALITLKENSCEAIISVGGGSVLDEAKAIACGYYQNDIWNPYMNNSLIKEALPIYSVLTLSATGSEANCNSVLSNTETKVKTAISHPSLAPVASFLNPEYQYTLPWRQTANGAIDSLSHVFEVYFTADIHDETTLHIAEAIMKSMIDTTNILQNEPENYDARASFAWASTLALNGLTRCGLPGDWACHAIEHAISGLHSNVAHAEGLAVVTPAWMQYVNKSKPEVFRRWSKNIFGVNNTNDAIEALKNKFKEWEAPTSLNDLKISDAEHSQIAELTISNANGNIGNVALLNKDAIITICKLAQS